MLLLLGVALCVILRSGPGVYAETYLAGEAGLTVPQSLQNIRVTSGPNSGAKATADDLKNSVVLGASWGISLRGYRGSASSSRALGRRRTLSNNLG